MSISIVSRRNHIYLDVNVTVDSTKIELGLHNKAEAIKLRDQLQIALDDINEEIEKLP